MVAKKLSPLSPAALKRAILEAKQQSSEVESKKKKVEGTEAIKKKKVGVAGKTKRGQHRFIKLQER